MRAGLTNGVGFGSTEFHVLRARVRTRVIRCVTSFTELHSTDIPLERVQSPVHAVASAGQQRVARGLLLARIAFRPFRLPSQAPHRGLVLDTVDEAIARSEAVIAKLKQTRVGLLHDLLTRGLDEHGQLRDPVAHPEQFKDSPLGRILVQLERRSALRTVSSK